MLHIPKIFKEVDFKKLDKDLQDDCKNQCKNGKGILLYGDSGIGKTYTFYAVAKFFEETLGKIRIINATKERPQGEGFTGGYISEFCNVDKLIHRLRNYNVEGEGEELLSYWTGSDSHKSILFLDDLGVEIAKKDNSFAIEVLTMILNYRYQELLPTFVNTNYSPEEMMEHLGKRIYSRLQGLCKFIPMVGEDKRLKEAV